MIYDMPIKDGHIPDGPIFDARIFLGESFDGTSQDVSQALRGMELREVALPTLRRLTAETAPGRRKRR